MRGRWTAVRAEPSNLPGKFELQQNYPNPFNPSTQISFSIPQAGNVSLKVYNVLGQEVATLMDGVKSAQTYNVTFNASALSSGVVLLYVEVRRAIDFQEDASP